MVETSTSYGELLDGFLLLPLSGGDLAAHLNPHWGVRAATIERFCGHRLLPLQVMVTAKLCGGMVSTDRAR